jgi:hypothetical protein
MKASAAPPATRPAAVAIIAMIPATVAAVVAPVIRVAESAVAIVGSITITPVA